MGLTLLGQPIVVLSSAKHAIDLLDKRGNIYSDRPRLVMGGELVGFNKTLALAPYDDRFREYRKNFAKAFGGRAQMETRMEFVEHEMAKFLQRVLDNPGRVAEQIRKYVLAQYTFRRAF